MHVLKNIVNAKNKELICHTRTSTGIRARLMLKFN